MPQNTNRCAALGWHYSLLRPLADRTRLPTTLDEASRGSLHGPVSIVPEWALVYVSLLLFVCLVFGLHALVRYALSGAPAEATRDTGGRDIETGHAH